MKKKIICLLLFCMVLSLTACGGKSADQDEVYEKINDLAGTFSSDYIAYTVTLTDDDTHIILHDTGTIRKENGEYSYSYSNESLNKIGSGADSLVSADEGTITWPSASAADITIPGVGDFKLFSLSLRDSFKTYDIAETDDTYVMTGYIARNTIIRYTENLDSDIRFYYEITADKDLTRIEKLVIQYATEKFDSVVITFVFEEGEQ